MTISTVFFDLGNVLIDFDPHLMLFHFEKISHKKRADLEKILSDFPPWHAYELGKTTTDDFIASLKNELDLFGKKEEIEHACCAIFTLNSQMVSILLALKKRYKLALISNTCHMHFNYLSNQYPIFHLFDKILLSHEVNLKKPDTKIFLKALESMGSKPDESVFIDDILSHIEAAKKCGMKAIHFKNASLLEKQFSVLGIQI